MPLKEPAERELVHNRGVDCQGYRRADGLWDIEGRLIDTKTYAFPNQMRGEVQAGEPVHDMWLRITLTDELEIVDAEASTDAHPFVTCPEITTAYEALVGTRLAPGWTKEVETRLGGVAGCTHLTHLARHLATVALQTIYPARSRYGYESKPSAKDKKPAMLDGCHALATDGAVVKAMWPRWYRKS